MEHVRPVHKPWIEITHDEDITWEPSRQDAYTGPAGGTSRGPTSAIQTVVRNAKSLVCVFLFVVPLSFIKKIARFTDTYAYKDWVVEKTDKDRDGKVKKRQ